MNLKLADFLKRRQLLLATLGAPLWFGAAAADGSLASTIALQKRALVFPRDLGSHPDTGIEWWYLTGELHAPERLFGFQLTFFRSRVPTTQGMTSAFSAKQLFFAHAAVSDVSNKRLLHDQRVARSSGVASVDLASSSAHDTEVQLRDWSLTRRDKLYLAQAQGPDFAFTLTLNPTQTLLLQGDQGWSRKGPDAAQASFYYSEPQLEASGVLTTGGKALPVTGRAWLDHEWSQSLLHPDAVGWDWIGMNLDDGSALTAFRLRRKDGSTLWAGGSWRENGTATAVIFAPDEVIFTPQRVWKSPASGASYAVQWGLAVKNSGIGSDVDAAAPASAGRRFTIVALIDNQELDSRASTGAIYWEGLSELLDAQGKRVGRGYLEMTGYASALIL